MKWAPGIARAIGATAVLLLAGSTAPVAAAATSRGQPANGAARVTAEAGYGGTFIAGHPVPVRVRVEADRLVRGTLEVVRPDHPRSSSSLPVEIPGGSTKQYRLVTPSDGTDDSFAALALSVRLVEGGRVIGSTSTRARSAIDQEMVGVLPGALAGQPLPGPTTLAVDAGTARFAALDEADLEQAPATLGPLSAVAAGGDELARLPTGARRGLLRWVASGGRLLVDAAPGTAVQGLPEGWRGDGTRIAAGRGELVFTDGAMGAGRWAGLIEPSARTPGFGRQGFFGSLGNALAADARLRVPRLNWLFWFLALYVVVAGPLTFGVLRHRGQAERAWIAVPMVALLFSSAGYLAGSDLRRRATLAHATILESSGGQASAVTFLGLASRHGGTASVRAGPGWVLGDYRSESGAAHGVAVASTEQGPVGRLALDAGQFGLIRASGPANLQGALEVTATSNADGTASGTVRNRTPFALRHVAVLVGDSGVAVGDLDAGSESRWTVMGNRQAREGFPPVEARLWPESWGTDTVEDDAPSLALWAEAPHGLAPGTRSNGTAVAVGWTDDYRPDLVVDGKNRARRGRTVLTSSAPVRGDGGRFGDLAVRSDLVSGRVVQAGPANQVVVDGLATVRFRLPGPADPSTLRVEVPLATSAEVWTTGGWERIHSGIDGRMGGAATEPEPSTALAPGSQVPTEPAARDLPARPVAPDSGGGFAMAPQAPPAPGVVARQPGRRVPSVTLALPAGALHGDAVFVRVRSMGTQLEVEQLNLRQVAA